jgi:hypothetical protein
MSKILKFLSPDSDAIKPILILSLHTAIIFALGRWLFSLADSSFTTWIDWSDFWDWVKHGENFLFGTHFGYITCMLHITVIAHFIFTYSDEWWFHIAGRIPLSILAGAGIAVVLAILGIVYIIVGWGISLLLTKLIGPLLTIGWEYLARSMFHLVTNSPIVAWWLMGLLIGGITGSYLEVDREYYIEYNYEDRIKWTPVWILTLGLVLFLGIKFWSK